MSSNRGSRPPSNIQTLWARRLKRLNEGEPPEPVLLSGIRALREKIEAYEIRSAVPSNPDDRND